nr:alpha-ketoglutarate-dependent dioxygenase alkB [Ipomoea batatas]
MYGSETGTEDVERTAFRKAEKKYKLYYDNGRKKKHPRPVDLSEVLDFKSISERYAQNAELPAGISKLQCDFDRPVFCLESHPGFYFIPGALTIEEQCQWIKDSLTSFPQPPNRTNHNVIYGPIEDLFVSAKQGKVLVEEEPSHQRNGTDSNNDQSTATAPSWKFSDVQSFSSRGEACKSVPASVLLRKLRWSTLGLQFDWSKRSYNVSLPHNKIPDDLCQLSTKLATPAMPSGEDFQPEAAIVNYFGQGDMLGGHLDDMEKDWSKPIVSMSLGCKAIFLIGGNSREHTPLAMFLRSGDVILMAGAARECFHGVPRIFTDKEHAEISELELQFSDEDDSFLEYVRTSRVNINIRQCRF